MKILKKILVVLVVFIWSPSLVHAVDMGDIFSAETRTGTLTNPAQIDSFTFTAQIGQTVVINMSRETEVLNPQIDLISPSGILENSVNCGDDSSGTGQCVNIAMDNHHLLESGIYTIIARDYAGNNTGEYSLSFSLIPNYSNQIPVLPETIQSYLILTNDSVPVTLPFGSYFEVYGSSGVNIVNVRMGARVQFQNFAGPNEINIEEASSRFTVHRSGTIVRLSSPAGTLIQIAAKQSAQTLRFADGSATLIINNNDVMIGDQFIHETEFELESPADTDDISVGKFW